MICGRVVSWCESNGLELNISKCKVIRYSRKKIITLPSYYIHNSALECLFQISDLGTILDSKLTFCSHIEKIVKNSNKMLGFMVHQCSEFDNLRALVLLYNALVRSNLEYNTIIWCPLYQNAIHRIEKIQRKFIKFACYKCHIHFDRNNYDYFIHHRFRPIVRLYFLDYSDNSTRKISTNQIVVF
jgi:hypothetical protein